MHSTVLIVDDHSLFRSAARALLEADDFEVVGAAADGRAGSQRPMTCTPTWSCSTFAYPTPMSSRWPPS